MALLYRTAKNAPILVAANREERPDRSAHHPKIQSGEPRVVCGVDRLHGGTWLGVNQHGLCVAVTNRRKAAPPLQPRSRGVLCRELLNLRTAKEAAKRAATQLETDQYDGANFVVADARFAAVVHGGDLIDIVELEPGLHLLSNGNMNDQSDLRQEFVRRSLTLHSLDSPVTFLAAASRTFARKTDAAGRGTVLTGRDFRTVSSTLLSLPRKIQQAVYQYAPGPPSDCPYKDYSALLRQVLSTEKAQRNKAAASDNGQKTTALPEKKAAIRKKK